MQAHGELIKHLAKLFGGFDANFGGPSQRVISGSQSYMQEALRRVTTDTGTLDRNDGMLKITEIDHRHLRRRLFVSIFHTKVRHFLNERVEQPRSIESGSGPELLAQPFYGHFQTKVGHASLLRLLLQ